MCSYRTYAVQTSAKAWVRFGHPPPAALLARVQEELDRIAAQMPICADRGGTAFTRTLDGRVSIIVAVDRAKGIITLVEVSELR